MDCEEQADNLTSSFAPIGIRMGNFNERSRFEHQHCPVLLTFYVSVDGAELGLQAMQRSI